MGDDGIKRFMEFNWQNVKTLDLSKNSITAEGLKILSKGNWQNLKELFLGNSYVTQLIIKFTAE